MLRIIIDVLIAIGGIFALAGTIGVMKMPDTYSRMQASTCIATMGVIGVCLGALLYGIFVMQHPGTVVKIIIIGALILATNPVGAHAIAKGSYKAGIRPKKKMQVDDYGRDFDE